VETSYLYTLVVGFIILAFVVRRAFVNDSKRRVAKERLKSLNPRSALYFCNSAEDLGEHLIQFYGEPFGITVRPGMKIEIPYGQKYIIKEVYGGAIPNKLATEILDGDKNTAVVIESDNFDWTSIKTRLKEDKIVGLKLY
jgi:hypothetical protein